MPIQVNARIQQNVRLNDVQSGSQIFRRILNDAQYVGAQLEQFATQNGTVLDDNQPQFKALFEQIDMRWIIFVGAHANDWIQETGQCRRQLCAGLYNLNLFKRKQMYKKNVKKFTISNLRTSVEMMAHRNMS